MVKSKKHYPHSKEYSKDADLLFSGVHLRALENHGDDRGVFTEIFRQSWGLGQQPLQWNIVKSKANVLRGIHVHKKHNDYLTLAYGEMLLALHDFRPNSITYQKSCFMIINEQDPHLIKIPVGVGHGFYFQKPALHVYGVSEYFDGTDEFGCNWNAPELNLEWPCTDPCLSKQDQTAMNYAKLIDTLAKDNTP